MAHSLLARDGQDLLIDHDFECVPIISKGQEVGRGSFGVVYKAQLGFLVCAAKHIHSEHLESSYMCETFKRECKLLAACKHPNVVQYLGTTTDPDTHQPVLLMELMDTNLGHYLTDTQRPLLYHQQINVCHDVVLALSYLHAIHIIHRDVCSFNILLKGEAILAKLCDLFMATTDKTELKRKCSGSQFYMPPEALRKHPRYNEKIDVFSFGVVIVELLTRKSPKPTKEINRKTSMKVPEVERRQNHIQIIDPNHSLLAIAIQCLRDNGDERPSAHKLCEIIVALKNPSAYTESVKARPESDREAQLKRELQSERHKHALELEHKREEIHRLQNEIKTKEELLQEVVENTSHAIDGEVQKRTSHIQQQLTKSQYETVEHQAQLRQQRLRTVQSEQELTQARQQIFDLKQMIINEQTRASRLMDEVNIRMQEKDDRIRQLETRLENASAEVLGLRFTQLQLLPQGKPWNVPRDDVIIIKEQIGYGAAGLVSKGRYQGQVVAVKQIHREIFREKYIMDAFKREVGILATIQHPNLVRFIAAVFDERVEQLQDTPLLVLELLHTNLRDAYKDYNLGASRSLHIFRDVAYALHYLHEHSDPIIHRDVSAPNVLLEALTKDTWRAKLSDFGSANFLYRSKTLGIGAIAYTAPELFPRDGPSAPMHAHPTTKCDIFSYGIVLVEVITTTMPTTENRHELFRQVQGKWQSMYELISQCVLTNPSDRPAMANVLHQLNRIPSAQPRIN